MVSIVAKKTIPERMQWIQSHSYIASVPACSNADSTVRTQVYGTAHNSMMPASIIVAHHMYKEKLVILQSIGSW